MSVLEPFSCVRPRPELASRVASGPHSTMSREEICRKVEENPLSYSRIAHPGALPGCEDLDPEETYRRAAETLSRWMDGKVMVRDETPSYYLYRLEAGGHVQSGLVGCVPVDDVQNGRIRAHERIRNDKLLDLACHMEICDAQIGGPILMTYRNRREITEWMEEVTERTPLYHFVSENGILNDIWKMDEPAELSRVRQAMGRVPALYIADGHHRALAAVEISRRRRREHPDSTGQEPWNWLACVCFPDDQLRILPYSRVAAKREELTEEEFLAGLEESFRIEPEVPAPRRRGEFAMILSGRAYRLTLREELRPASVPESLDVSVLCERVLHRILHIDPAGGTDQLEYVGGREQRSAVEEMCREPGRVGFIPWPISLEELLAVADAKATMPPKSTWFEPKLCNGLFIHTFS